MYVHSLLCLLFSIFLIQGCVSAKLKQTNSQHLFHSMSQDWYEHGDAQWTLANQILSSHDGVGYAVAKDQYTDFILELDFKPNETMNSGIFIRCPEVNFTASACYEINIADDHSNQDFRTGSIVSHGKPLKHVDSKNQWNTYKISAVGKHIEVWLNGIKTADLIDDKSSSGFLGLQINGKGSIQFRNVRITEI